MFETETWSPSHGEAFSSDEEDVKEMCQNGNADWRARKCNFNEQVARFYMNDEMADVEFVFNKQDGITVCLSIHHFYFVDVLENSSTLICTFCGLRSI